MIKAKNNYVLVKKHAAPTVERGIHLAGQDPLSTGCTGDVISVGPRVTDIKEGDLVCFNQYSGTAMRVGDFEALILTDDRVLGLISSEA